MTFVTIKPLKPGDRESHLYNGITSQACVLDWKYLIPFDIIMGDVHQSPEPCSCCKRIAILAVDGSEHSDRAIKWFFKNIYHQKEDHVYIYHAFEYPTMPAAPYPYGFAYYEEWGNIVKRADEEAVNLLGECGNECLRCLGCAEGSSHKNLKQDMHIQMYKETVRAGEGICNMAKDYHADLIVMGSRGLGTFRRTFLGSTSDYVVHHANVPTIIVPPQPPPDHCLEQQHKE